MRCLPRPSCRIPGSAKRHHPANQNRPRSIASVNTLTITSAPTPTQVNVQATKGETDLFGFTISGHPLDLYQEVAWETYCSVTRLKEYIGQTVVCCGLVIEQRLHHQVTGEVMKFMTLADHTGIVETELFADTYRSYGIVTVRYPVLEVHATVEPYENGRGFSLRVHRVGKPRTTS